MIMINFLLSIILGFGFFGGREIDTRPHHEVIGDRVQAEAIGYIAKKYNLELAGIGGGMMGCIRRMDVAFGIKKPLDKDEARALLVNVVEDFLRIVNADEEVKPYLVHVPFTAKNLSVVIFIYTPDGRTVYYPNLSHVSVSGDKVFFRSADVDVYAEYKIKESELYEEAFETVKQQGRLLVDPDLHKNWICSPDQPDPLDFSVKPQKD